MNSNTPVELVLKAVREWLVQSSSRPWVVAISGAQGIGKTTLGARLVETLKEEGVHSVSLSIDDFYLNRIDQIELASSHASEPLLQQRGYPGTHDIALGKNILKALKARKQVSLPVYDKSAYEGQGDRVPESEFKTLDTAVDLVLLDGWMVGFQKQESVDPALRVINERLEQYQEWWDLIDAWVFLEPESVDFVVDWRIEAEEKMKASGKAGMSRDQIREYILKFLPAYRQYLPAFKRFLKTCTQPVLHLKIGRNRQAL